jgi:hypothetical protein
MFGVVTAKQKNPLPNEKSGMTESRCWILNRDFAPHRRDRIQDKEVVVTNFTIRTTKDENGFL